MRRHNLVPATIRQISRAQLQGYSGADTLRAISVTPSGANVSIIGGGGIAESLVSMLRAFRSRITVVRRSPDHIDGADEVLAPDRLVDALSGADLVVLALPLTEEKP